MAKCNSTQSPRDLTIIIEWKRIICECYKVTLTDYENHADNVDLLASRNGAAI